MKKKKKKPVKDNVSQNNNVDASYFIMPTNGQSAYQKWLERSASPCDMIAAGAFDLAQESLHRQFGVVNFQPLKQYFLHIYLSSHAELPLIPNTSDIAVGLRRNPESNDSHSPYLPAISLSLGHCHEFVKLAYISTTKAAFQESIDSFRKALHIIPFLIIRTSDELKDVRSIIKTCSQYICALRVKIEAEDPIGHEDSSAA